MEDVISKILMSLLIVPFPLLILIAPGPARHGSWWYPDPDRLDYRFKLLLYAILVTNNPKDEVSRWSIRGIAILVLVVPLIFIWVWQPCN